MEETFKVCRIFYLEEFPEEYQKFIKVNSLF